MRVIGEGSQANDDDDENEEEMIMDELNGFVKEDNNEEIADMDRYSDLIDSDGFTLRLQHEHLLRHNERIARQEEWQYTHRQEVDVMMGYDALPAKFLFDHNKSFAVFRRFADMLQRLVTRRVRRHAARLFDRWVDGCESLAAREDEERRWREQRYMDIARGIRIMEEMMSRAENRHLAKKMTVFTHAYWRERVAKELYWKGLRKRSAVEIQRISRGLLARRLRDRLIAEKREKNADILCKWWRGAAAMMAAMRRLIQLRREREALLLFILRTNAATRIQRNFRSHQSRMREQAKACVLTARMNVLSFVAVIIQRNWRMKSAIIEAAHRRVERDALIQSLLAEHGIELPTLDVAALTVQQAWASVRTHRMNAGAVLAASSALNAVENHFAEIDDGVSASLIMALNDADRRIAAAKIQVSWRESQIHRLLHAMARKVDRYVRASSVAIQTSIRGYWSRQHLLILQEVQHRAETRAAIFIQRKMRTKLSVIMQKRQRARWQRFQNRKMQKRIRCMRVAFLAICGYNEPSIRRQRYLRWEKWREEQRFRNNTAASHFRHKYLSSYLTLWIQFVEESNNKRLLLKRAMLYWGNRALSFTMIRWKAYVDRVMNDRYNGHPPHPHSQQPQRNYPLPHLRPRSWRYARPYAYLSMFFYATASKVAIHRATEVVWAKRVISNAVRLYRRRLCWWQQKLRDALEHYRRQALLHRQRSRAGVFYAWRGLIRTLKKDRAEQEEKIRKAMAMWRGKICGLILLEWYFYVTKEKQNREKIKAFLIAWRYRKILPLWRGWKAYGPRRRAKKETQRRADLYWRKKKLRQWLGYAEWRQYKRDLKARLAKMLVDWKMRRAFNAFAGWRDWAMAIVGARKFRASTLIENSWRRQLAYRRARLMRVGRYYVWLDRVQGEKDILFLGDQPKLKAGDRGRTGSIHLIRNYGADAEAHSNDSLIYRGGPSYVWNFDVEINRYGAARAGIILAVVNIRAILTVFAIYRCNGRPPGVGAGSLL